VWSTRRLLDRAPAQFDVTHIWRFNSLYALPTTSQKGPIGAVLNGWQMSGILAVQTGYPFSPVDSTNRSLSGTNGGGGGIDRPDLNPAYSGNIIKGGPEQYFDPSAFTLQPAGFLGDAGRNILRGPSKVNLDLSMLKGTAVPKLGESGKLEFRAEFFNILNHANFDMPNNVVFNGTARNPVAGQITATSGKSRQIQLALRLLF
jgi:hypothetical protein